MRTGRADTVVQWTRWFSLTNEWLWRYSTVHGGMTKLSWMVIDNVNWQCEENYSEFWVLWSRKLISFQSARWLVRKGTLLIAWCSRVGVRTGSWPLNVPCHKALIPHKISEEQFSSYSIALNCFCSSKSHIYILCQFLTTFNHKSFFLLFS